MIRAFEQQDFAARLAMHEREPGTQPSIVEPQIGRQVIEQLFPALHRTYPLQLDSVRSLVDVDENGDMSGMLGIVPRQLQFGDRTLSMAVCVELLTGSSKGAWMTGVKLLKALFEGEQDVAISDLANRETRNLWERLGGEVIGIYNWNWLKVLRPATTIRWMAESRGVPGVIGKVAHPVAALADKLAVRTVRYPIDGFNFVPLTSDEFARQLATFNAEELSPIYTQSEARWLWQRLDYIWREAGRSTQLAVIGDDGQMLGWFIYQFKPGHPARVAHLTARPGSEEQVLLALFASAEQAGACGLTGRVQPRFLQALADARCFLTARETPVLAHSRHADVMRAIRAGDFAFTLLDGEGPVQLWNNPVAALSSLPKLTPVANK